MKHNEHKNSQGEFLLLFAMHIQKAKNSASVCLRYFLLYKSVLARSSLYSLTSVCFLPPRAWMCRSHSCQLTTCYSRVVDTVVLRCTQRGSNSRGCENWLFLGSLALLLTYQLTSVTGNVSVDVGLCFIYSFWPASIFFGCEETCAPEVSKTSNRSHQKLDIACQSYSMRGRLRNAFLIYSQTIIQTPYTN